eukprot:m.158881 g.158881  ORF g.158881 m.158881 type:complete len:92 (+) comp16476_c0_seq9:2725-3000(+)
MVAARKTPSAAGDGCSSLSQSCTAMLATASSAATNLSTARGFARGKGYCICLHGGQRQRKSALMDVGLMCPLWSVISRVWLISFRLVSLLP